MAVCRIKRQHGFIACLLVHDRRITLRTAAAGRQSIEFTHICRKALHLTAFRRRAGKGQSAHIHRCGLDAKYHRCARPNHLCQTNAGQVFRRAACQRACHSQRACCSQHRCRTQNHRLTIFRQNHKIVQHLVIQRKRRIGVNQCDAARLLDKLFLAAEQLTSRFHHVFHDVLVRSGQHDCLIRIYNCRIEHRCSCQSIRHITRLYNNAAVNVIIFICLNQTQALEIILQCAGTLGAIGFCNKRTSICRSRVGLSGSHLHLIFRISALNGKRVRCHFNPMPNLFFGQMNNVSFDADAVLFEDFQCFCIVHFNANIAHDFNRCVMNHLFSGHMQSSLPLTISDTQL